MSALVIVFLVLLVCSLYIFFRNNKVYLFSLEVIDLAHNTAEKHIDAGMDDWEDVCDLTEKHGYMRMLFSFKPLKLEYWYTEDEIRKMKGEDL